MRKPASKGGFLRVYMNKGLSMVLSDSAKSSLYAFGKFLCIARTLKRIGNRTHIAVVFGGITSHLHLFLDTVVDVVGGMDKFIFLRLVLD